MDLQDFLKRYFLGRGNFHICRTNIMLDLLWYIAVASTSSYKFRQKHKLCLFPKYESFHYKLLLNLLKCYILLFRLILDKLENLLGELLHNRLKYRRSLVFLIFVHKFLMSSRRLKYKQNNLLILLCLHIHHLNKYLLWKYNHKLLKHQGFLNNIVL